MSRFLPQIFETVGYILLTAAGWVVYPALGVAVAGASCLVIAWSATQ